MKPTLSRTSLFGGPALALLLAPAAAIGQDAADFAQKFTAAYAYSGYDITLGAGSGEGGTLTYDGAGIAMPDLGLVEPVQVEGPVVFTGVAATSEGGYTAESMSLPDLAIDLEGLGISVAGIRIEDIAVPAGPAITATEAIGLIGSLSTGVAAVTLDGHTVFGFASSHAALVPAGSGDVFETTSTIEGLIFDLSGIDFPELQAGLAAIGMTSGTGSMKQHATWSPTTGEMDIDETSITLDGLGKISFALTMQGYTTALVDAAAAGRETMKAITDPEERAAAQLELAQTMLDGIGLSRAALTYADKGLVGKLIGFAAEAQGISRDEVADGLAVSLPALLLRSGDLAATALAAQASSAFLNDPKTLEIAIDFPTLLSFAGLDLEDPESVPEIPEGMAVTLKANGIGPIPLDLEGIDLEPLLGGMDLPAMPESPAAEPHVLPAPGRDPRTD